MIQTIAYYANGLYDTVTALDEALSYVTRLFDELAGSAQVLKRFRSSVLALTSAIQVFEDATPGRARRAFWRALRYAPTWLLNEGFVRRGVQAHLPARSFSRPGEHL